MNQKLPNLSLLNLIRRPQRSSLMALLAGLLCFFLLGGSLLLSGLQTGIHSLQDRLGADIMVVPYEATTKSQFSNLLLQGNPGYFYMSRSSADKIEGVEGIAQYSEQLYLASAKSSCCSTSVQIIGFDPETDFTITPWVKLSNSRTIGDMEVFAGNDLNAFAGEKITLYGTELTVAGKLDRTGTYMDTAVYVNIPTLKTLIREAQSRSLFTYGEEDADSLVSCVLIDVAENYTVEDVLNDINLHVRKVSAVETQNMIADTTAKLDSIRVIMQVMMAAIWLLSLILMMVAFFVVVNERKKEFAVLRAIGASRREVFGTVFNEALMISACGCVPGTVAAVLLASLMSRSIQKSMNLPFLLPTGGTLVALIAVAAAVTIVTGACSAGLLAFKISQTDAALILREEA